MSVVERNYEEIIATVQKYINSTKNRPYVFLVLILGVMLLWVIIKWKSRRRWSANFVVVLVFNLILIGCVGAYSDHLVTLAENDLNNSMNEYTGEVFFNRQTHTLKLVSANVNLFCADEFDLGTVEYNKLVYIPEGRSYGSVVYLQDSELIVYYELVLANDS